MNYRSFILFICAITMVGCGKQPNNVTISQIKNDIQSIGDVTVEDKELIESIDNAISSLSSSEKELITNYEDFLIAKGELNALLKIDEKSTSQDEISTSEGSSTESEEYDIPELVGMDLEEAKKILDKYGMTINIKEAFDDNIPENCIISYPHRKYSKNKNSINLTVSQGKGVNILISNYYPVDKIINELQEKGLKPKIEYSVEDIGLYNMYDPTDYIIDANYGSMVKENSEITIYVAKPPLKCINPKFKINSADGCELSFELQNLSDKQIAYITFDFYFYDTMGNPVECSVKRTNHIISRVTGPLEPGEIKGCDFGAMFYNQTVGVIYPKTITIEYTDKTIQNIKNEAYFSTQNFYGGKLND